jgi:hypothetical protein
MRYFNPDKLFIAAFALIVASNIIIFYGVFANKTGEPTSNLTLTERELQLPFRNKNENSAISLRINYRTAIDNPYSRGETRWLSTKKLQTLGFDVENDMQKKGSDFLNKVQKEVFLALEYDGKAYQDALEYATKKVETLQEQGAKGETLKRAIKELQSERLHRSRLFVIDADTDATALREKYPDKAKYIIAKGLITARYKNKAVRANISGLSIKNIYVPFEHSGLLQTLQPTRKTDNKPRYSVTLKYGTRFEPYITSLKRLKTDTIKVQTLKSTLSR